LPTDARTIVLTAQDFAALTRQVKSQSDGANKSSPTVRIQALPPKQSQQKSKMPVEGHSQSKPATTSVTIPVQQPGVNNKVPIMKKPVTAAVTSFPATPVVTTAPSAVKCVPQPIPGRQDLEVSLPCFYQYIAIPMPSYYIVWFYLMTDCCPYFR
jgi:hypothetical protein